MKGSSMEIDTKDEKFGGHVRSEMNSIEEQDIRLRAMLRNKSDAKLAKKAAKHEPIEPVADKIFQEQDTMADMKTEE